MGNTATEAKKRQRANRRAREAAARPATTTTTTAATTTDSPERPRPKPRDEALPRQASLRAGHATWTRILTLACPTHDAPTGAPCWSNPSFRAVCGQRVVEATR